MQSSWFIKVNTDVSNLKLNFIKLHKDITSLIGLILCNLKHYIFYIL